MKISTLIWLKSFGGVVNPVYSSKLYAIEFDDTTGYEVDLREIKRVRSASYGEAATLDHLDAYNTIQSLTKTRSASYSEREISDAVQMSSEIAGISKVRSASYGEDGFNDSVSTGNSLTKITKRLAAGYISRRLPAEAFEAGSAAELITKHRAARSASAPPDAMSTENAIQLISKSRKVVKDTVRDAFAAENAIHAIIKNSHAIRASFTDGINSGSVMASIDKVRRVAPSHKTLNLVTGYVPPEDGNYTLNLKTD